MSDFEVVFVLYSLLLGLSLVELLTGFGRALERRLTARSEDIPFRIGWLTPLLGMFVLLDLLSFWTFAWIVRDGVQVTTRGLFGVLIFASAYFMAARLVFPSTTTRDSNLDSHYFAVHRVVLGILLALLAMQWAVLSTFETIWPALSQPFSVFMTVVLAALMLAAAWVRHPRWSVVILVVLIARYALVYLLR